MCTNFPSPPPSPSLPAPPFPPPSPAQPCSYSDACVPYATEADAAAHCATSADPSQCHVSSNDRSGLSPLRFVLQNHLSSCGLVRHGQVALTGLVDEERSGWTITECDQYCCNEAWCKSFQRRLSDGVCQFSAENAHTVPRCNTSTATACYKTDTTFDLYMPASHFACECSLHPPPAAPPPASPPKPPGTIGISSPWPAPADGTPTSDMVSTNIQLLIPRRVMTKDECEAYAAGIGLPFVYLSMDTGDAPAGVP